MVSLKKSILSRFDTETLKKFDTNSTKIIIIVAVLWVMEFLLFYICGMWIMHFTIEDIEWVIPICLTFAALIFLMYLSIIISQEICRRKDNETVEAECNSEKDHIEII